MPETNQQPLDAQNQSISAPALWQRYGRMSWQEMPESVKTVANQSVLDWFACTIAGSREPLAQILREEFAGQSGPATVVGTTMRTDPKSAALINGATSHALDFDDTNLVMGGHSTVPVFPAVLALAEELGASGERLMAAFVVGTEIEGRLGSAIGGGHYAKGWHVTSTMGVFGAAAGAAHLLELNEEQFGHAMGLAASQASGLKANFGTMTKPFHAGHAAERGLLSARLARRGFTANPEAFTHQQGLIHAAGSGTVHEARLAALGDGWTTTQTLFKYHAACYLTHAAIESTLRLRPSVAASELVGATVVVNPSLLDVCAIAQPNTGLEGKFSLAATIALALLGLDTTDPNTFVDATIQREDVQRLIGKVRVDTDASFGQTQSIVHLDDSRQQRHTAEHDAGVPATDLVQQQAKLEAKARGIAGVEAAQLGDLASAATLAPIQNLLN